MAGTPDTRFGPPEFVPDMRSWHPENGDEIPGWAIRQRAYLIYQQNMAKGVINGEIADMEQATSELENHFAPVRLPWYQRP